jgi:hypothetical protein
MAGSQEAAVLREPAEVRFAAELSALAESDTAAKPPGWKLSPTSEIRSLQFPLSTPTERSVRSRNLPDSHSRDCHVSRIADMDIVAR